MRLLGYSLVALSLLTLAGGVALPISMSDVYGWHGWREELSQGWWVIVVAAVLAAAGWLVLRIGSRTRR